MCGVQSLYAEGGPDLAGYEEQGVALVVFVGVSVEAADFGELAVVQGGAKIACEIVGELVDRSDAVQVDEVS